MHFAATNLQPLAIEQELVAQVSGTIAEGGLARLAHGLAYEGRALPPIKVSVSSSSEAQTRLRFALKGIRPGQVPYMCDSVGLRLLALKRIRIGRVALATLPPGQWRYLLAQGFALFCCNFLCFYYASAHVPSGLVAVVFSTAPIWNAINGRLFLGRPVRPAVMGGAVLGLAGIALLFLPQMAGHWNDGGMLAGLALALLGTLCFSAGNLLSSRMQALGLTPMLTNTWAMFIGATMLKVP